MVFRKTRYNVTPTQTTIHSDRVRELQATKTEFYQFKQIRNFPEELSWVELTQEQTLR